MGHSHIQNNHHHQAADGLMNMFMKANHDLSIVYHKLEKEFGQIYPDNANPIMLVSRIKKVQDDLVSLKEQCREVLAAKQDLIDKARTTLVGNKLLVQQLEASTGVAVTKDSDDSSYSNFKEVIDEWTTQIRSRTGDEGHESSPKDINKLLFSAIVQGN